MAIAGDFCRNVLKLVPPCVFSDAVHVQSAVRVTVLRPATQRVLSRAVRGRLHRTPQDRLLGKTGVCSLYLYRVMTNNSCTVTMPSLHSFGYYR